MSCIFQNSGTAVFSMDALFGLPRKKLAGSSYRDALHGDLFFGSQAEVDEHVASYKNQKIDNVSVIILTKGYTSQINLFPRYAIISLLVIP